MRKRVLLLFIALIGLFLLVGCADKHNYTPTVIAPTCTQDGYTVYACTHCEKTYESDVVSATGHAPTVTKSAISATCTAGGETEEITCSLCKEVLQASAPISAFGHTPTVTKEPQIPTCTLGGFTAEEYCKTCNVILQAQVPVEQLGHIEAVSKAYVAATCEQDGATEERTCERCQEVLQASAPIPAFGHTVEVTKPSKEETCTETGLTEEKACISCQVVFQEQTEIPAFGHTPEVTKQGQAATCLQTGLTEEKTCKTCHTVLQNQTRVDALGHDDKNGDCFCDRCDELYSPNMRTIASVEDLRNVGNDLSGDYKLIADISLAGQAWDSLGGKNQPFTGHFFGNGYSISDLSVHDQKVGGLFAYNSGTIHGVTLKNVSVSIENKNATVGGLAAYNKGKIVDCSLDGNNTLINTVYYYLKTSHDGDGYEWGSESYTGVFGGFCGENEGMIEGCISKSPFACTYNNTAKYEFEAAVFGFKAPDSCDRLYELKANSSVYFGGIAGRNSGTIKNCEVKGESAHAVNVYPVKVKTHGCVVAETTAYIGGIVGENAAQIVDCRAEKPAVTKSGEGYVATVGCACGGATGIITLLQNG
ncbi:MAG: hypothetical protein IJX96_03370 [Clostridia bacterium]|nr:hypothetical protein [Clostridia bacterium]